LIGPKVSGDPGLFHRKSGTGCAKQPYPAKPCHARSGLRPGGGEGLETIDVKWLEKLEMTSLHTNTVMTHFPAAW